MQVKIILSRKELTQIAQQATLIDTNLSDDSMVSLTIDDHRIAVDVPNMARSLQREIVVDQTHKEYGAMISEPHAASHALG